MDYMKMSIDDIINWCVENGETAWLKKEAARKVECKVYPRKKIVNEEGKSISVADKSQEPKITKRKISFIQIKQDFVEKFMPEIKPEKENKEDMYSRIAAL